MKKPHSPVLGRWARRLDEVGQRADLPRNRLDVMPLDVPAVAASTHLVDDPAHAQRAVDDLHALRIRALAIDTEFRFSRDPVQLREGREWNDIRSLVPLALSVAAWVEEPGQPSRGYIARYVFDLRVASVAAQLPRLLRLRVPMIFHHLKAELFVFWTMNLAVDPWLIYDTAIAAAAIHLGVHHPRAAPPATDPEAEVQQVLEAQRRREHVVSLVGQCELYALGYPYSAEEKDALRRRFLALRGGSRLDPELVEYAAADAEFTLRVYAAQQLDVVHLGLAPHLYQTEFAFVSANAHIEWNGALLSPDRMKMLVTSCEKAAEYYGRRLIKLGMKNPGSPAQFSQLMERLGLLHLFTEKTPGGRISISDDTLELLEDTLEDEHQAIRSFRYHQRFKRIAQERWLTGVLRGADGRHHPGHRQLGAHTGRNSCIHPNLAGIGKIFRPILVAPPGRAIVELDFSQVEVGICAAEYGDEKLIAAYNSSDVYTHMARLFYEGELTPVERRMSLRALKRSRPDLRNNMKTFVLASLYGMQAESIRLRFNLSRAEAERQLDRFLGLFPISRSAMDDSVAFGLVRGYAYTVSGLRRHLPPGKRATTWTRNLLRNTPVQGSAAVVFKKAIVDLDAEFRGSSTLIVLPVHDAVVLECDLNKVRSVAARAAAIMQHAIRSFYPVLTGRVDVNLQETSCWNKDGRADSLDEFLRDPSFHLG